MRLSILLAVIIFASVPAVPQHQRGQSSKQETPASEDSDCRSHITTIIQQQPSSGTRGPDATGKQEGEGEKPKITDWLMVVLTAAYIFVSVLVFIAIKGQNRFAERTVALTRESIQLTHRPKILIRSVVIPWAEILNRTTPMNAGDNLQEGLLEGFFYAVNIGSQPATIRRIDEFMAFTDRLPMERPYESGRDAKTVNISVKPGEACKISFKPQQVSIGDMAQMAIKNGPFVVLGRVAYTDDMGISRETAFCRKLDRTSHRLIPVDDQDYEYAD